MSYEITNISEETRQIRIQVLTGLREVMFKFLAPGESYLVTDALQLEHPMLQRQLHKGIVSISEILEDCEPQSPPPEPAPEPAPEPPAEPEPEEEKVELPDFRKMLKEDLLDFVEEREIELPEDKTLKDDIIDFLIVYFGQE